MRSKNERVVADGILTKEIVRYAYHDSHGEYDGITYEIEGTVVASGIKGNFKTDLDKYIGRPIKIIVEEDYKDDYED